MLPWNAGRWTLVAMRSSAAMAVPSLSQGSSERAMTRPMPPPTRNRNPQPVAMHDLALPSFGRTTGDGGACFFGFSLCSGASGLDLGLTVAIPGYRAVVRVEREPNEGLW